MRSVSLGLRWIAKRPVTSLISAVCLATGMSACVVAWILVDAVVLRPFELDDTGELVVVWETDPARNQPLIEVSFLNFLDWQRESRTVERMATFGSQHWPALVRIGLDMVPLSTRGVSADFFPVLGVQPILGRNFEPADADASRLPPLVLSHRFWQQRLGGRTSVITERLFVNGEDHAIIGVMPPGFAYPADPDAWVSVERVLGEAFQSMPATQQRLIGVLEVLARRHEAASNEEVRAELTSIVQRLHRQHSPNGGEPTRSAAVTPFPDSVVGDLGTRLWIAFGMGAAVWLLACANVAAVRAAQLRERAGEIAARLLLGATRGRIARELTLETAPLSIGGAILGAVASRWLIDLLGTAGAIRESGVRLDDRGAFAALLLVMLALGGWVLASLWPAWWAARRDAAVAQFSTVRVLAPVSRVGAPLVAAQAAIAIAVVALATVALQTFGRLSSIDLGFATSGVTLVDIGVPSWKYDTQADTRLLVDRLQNALRAVPAIRQVAAVSVRPFRFGEIVDGLPVRRGGDALLRPEEATAASRVVVTPDYFEALGQPLLSGRTFASSDGADAGPVVIISRTLARALFGDRPAVGERIETFSVSERWRSRVVVGLAADAQYRGLERPSMEVYMPHTQVNTPLGSLVVSASAPIAEATIRDALRRVEPDLAIERMQTTGELAASILNPARLLTTVVSFLATAGLLLVALGVFGAAASAVRAAWREIAVRQAIGARPLEAARAPLTTLARALAVGLMAGATFTPLVLSAAAVLGLEATTSTMLPLGAAVCAVATAAALAAAPALWRATQHTPADLLRES